MAAPVFVAEYETSWTGNPSSLSQSVTTAVGDILVLVAAESNGGGSLGTPTDSGPGLTWTLRQSVHVSTSWSDVYIWTATATSAATFNITVAKTGGSPVWGFNVLRFSGSAGIGASSKTNVSSGAPSLGLTTTGANSAVVFINADWNAVDGASRTYRSVNGTPTEQTYVRVSSSTVTNYVAVHADAGAAGAKTVGLSAPSGQKYSIAAVEVLASSGATSYPVSGTAAASSSSSGAVSALLGVSGSAAASSTSSGSVSALLGVSGSAAGVSASSAAVAALRPVAGVAAAALSGSSGSVAARLRVSGSAAAVSGSSGAAGAALAVSGVAAAVTGAAGAVAARFAVSGVAAVFSSSSGAASKLVPVRDLRIVSASVPVTGWTTGALGERPWVVGSLTIRELVRSGPVSAWTAEPVAGFWETGSPDISVLSGSGPASSWDASSPEN